MNEKVSTTAPCEACGGLLPLKPLQATRRQRQRKQDGPSIDAHRPELQGSTNEYCESSQGVLLSDSETEEVSSGKMRSYDSVLEEIQAIFANQKVKRETISPYMHRAHRPHRERKFNKPTRHERSLQAHQHAITHRSSISRSPADGHSPCFLHPHQGHEPPCKSSIVGPSDEPSCKRSIADEATCKRVLGRLPQKDASNNCSFDPLRISPSPRIHAAQCSTHHLGEQSVRGQAQTSSPNCKRHHGAPRNIATCREPPAEQNTLQPRMENSDCDLKCRIHHIDEHVTATLITSPRRSQSPQQQILYSCHQRTVVQHHDSGCHLHPESPPRKSCPRCGCPERESYTEVHLPEPAEEHHHSPKITEQEVIACALRCKMLKTPKAADVCGVCCHPKDDHVRDQVPKETIQECHLHGQIPNPELCQEKPAANPKCSDPLVWVPRQVRKPKAPSSVHWLDRLVASQKFPAHVVQQFLQGKRKCPPRVKKPKCAACMAKSLKVSSREPRDDSQDDTTTVECKKQHWGKLSRLALSRSLIIKPVVKLSTAQGPWTTRMEFQVCSECRNPLKSGRWKSILEEMSSNMPGKKCCSTKRVSYQTIHGLVLPSDAHAQAFDLRCPELFSAFRLHSKIQKMQKETFDRRAAMQVAQTEGIELDEEIFDQLLPEVKKSVKGKRSKISPRNYVSRQQRREVYRDLCKIVDPPPMPASPVQCPQRDVGVQVSNAGRPPQDFSTWNPSDFGAEPCLHSDRTVQSRVQLCTPVPTYRPEQEQPETYQEQDKSWDEQHWAYLVEACKQTRMEQGVYGSCAACQ